MFLGAANAAFRALALAATAPRRPRQPGGGAGSTGVTPERLFHARKVANWAIALLHSARSTALSVAAWRALGGAAFRNALALGAAGDPGAMVTARVPFLARASLPWSMGYFLWDLARYILAIMQSRKLCVS